MKKLSIISRSTLIATATSALLVSGAFAQQNTTSSFGIEVSSPIYEYSLKPGDTQQDIIKVKNVGTDKATYYPEILDFTSDNSTGAPKFLPDSEDNGKYSLKRWISITKESVTIDPDKSEAFNFIISVPADAEAGGHYAGILFSTDPAAIGGTGAALKSKVGSLVLVRIAGDIKESASIKSFKSDKDSYDNANKINFDVNIENTGNVHVQPKGVVTVKNIFGGKVASVDVNSLSANVLPGSTRVFNSTWTDPGFKLGFYTATVTLNYGNPSQAISAQTSFWIIPWMTLLLILIAIIITLVVLYFAIKKYNSWIVARATKKSPDSQ